MNIGTKEKVKIKYTGKSSEVQQIKELTLQYNQYKGRSGKIQKKNMDEKTETENHRNNLIGGKVQWIA